MRDTRSLASLSPELLARKGRARPAMRRQVHPSAGQGGDDLGWNDWGTGPQETPPPPVASVTAQPVSPETPEPVVSKPVVVLAQVPAEPVALAPEVPDILRQIDDLTQRIASTPAPAPVVRSKNRRAAFTLRLDSDRHLRLRLTSTVLDRSAQEIVTEALDAYIAQMPEIAALAALAVKKR